MRIAPGKHLTYCLNVHPGESWTEIVGAVRDHAVEVMHRAGGAVPFGLGLRIGAEAARELARTPQRLHLFQSCLDRWSMYAFTVNAFPYGRFHDMSVKEQVFRPDWTREERARYTCRVADALACLVPEDTYGSISTAPLTFKGGSEWAANLPAAVSVMAEVVAHLYELKRRTGREIVLAIEPEPGCYPETTDEAVETIELLLERGVQTLRRDLGYSSQTAENAARTHVGICFDTAHAAVEFEDLSEALRRFKTEGIRVAKVQLSAAIEAADKPRARDHLATFADAVYLHQVSRRTDNGNVEAWLDLPEFMARSVCSPNGVFRVHYHVPLFVDRFDACRGTGYLLDSPAVMNTILDATDHIEVETYTWQVWKEATKSCIPIEAGIAAELRWVMERIAEARCAPS